MYFNSNKYILILLIQVSGIFIICGLIEYIRQKIFLAFENSDWFNNVCTKMDKVTVTK